MTESDNKDVLRRVFEATAQAYGRPFVEALAEDVRRTIIGTTPWSGTYVGKTSVLEDLLRPLSVQLDGGNTIRAHRFIAEDDCVVVDATGHNRTADRLPYENACCWIIRMRDGFMTEIVEYADTQLFFDVLKAPPARAGMLAKELR